MRITVLTTGTNNTKVIYAPLANLGHRLKVIVYDEMDSHADLPRKVAGGRPDVVVYIGALEAHHGKPVPPVEIFAAIGAEHPMVHICCDGAEPFWWEQLQRYYDRGNFALQVNIDGVRTGPIGERGLTMLCPVDPAAFAVSGNVWRAWPHRPRALGFAGNTHRGAREAMLAELVAQGTVDFRQRDAGPPEDYLDYLLSCRCIWNHPMTGGTTSKHVKARILEAALAGCLVLEEKGSPAERWFEPGWDYLAYTDAASVAELKASIGRNLARAEEMATRFRNKVAAEHSPSVFWSLVFERMGLGETEHVLRQVPYVYWGHISPPEPDAPLLIETRGDVNMVGFNGSIFAVPHHVGPIDIDKVRIPDYPSIREFGSLAEARKAVRM